MSAPGVLLTPAQQAALAASAYSESALNPSATGTVAAPVAADAPRQSVDLATKLSMIFASQWTARTAPAGIGRLAKAYGNSSRPNWVATASSGSAVYASPSAGTQAAWVTPSVTGGMRNAKAVTYSGSLYLAVGTNLTATSPDGKVWTLYYQPFTFTVVKWCAASGLFIAGCSAGAGRLLTSPDGINWTVRLVLGDGVSAAGAIAVKGSVVVAAGLGISGTGSIYASTDGGITWVQPSVPPATSTSAAAVISADATKFVLFYSLGNNGAYSADGITWTSIPLVTGGVQSIANDGSNWVALVNGVSAWTSPDGINWTPRTSTSSSHQWVVWNGSNFVAPSDYSSDGVTWTARTIQTFDGSSPGSLGVTLGPAGRIVAVGVNDGAIYSDDGISWYYRTFPAAATTQGAPAWSGSVYCVPMAGTAGFATSPDGIWWSPHSTSGIFAQTAVAWSPELSLFAAVGQGAASSPDGITWTSRTVPNSGGTWSAIVWAGSIGLFVAVGQNGGCMTSPDGINWTLRNLGNAGPANYTSVVWNGTKLVAVGPAGSVSSTDGVNWTTRDPAVSSVAFNGSVYVGVGTAGGGSGTGAGGAWSSTDGVEWTSRGTPNFGATWRRVIWVDTLALFVAAGSAGVMTSPDGITWTKATGPTSGYFVHWNGTQLLVGSSGTTAFTSPDGVTWTARTVTGAAGNCSGIAWSDSLSLYVYVTTSTLLTSPDGVTWTLGSTTAAGFPIGSTLSYGFSGVEWDGAKFVTLMLINGGNGSAALTSPDGVVWTATPLSEVFSSAALHGFAWNGTKFIAVSSSSLYPSGISSDGVTWTPIVTPFAWPGTAAGGFTGGVSVIGTSFVVTSNQASPAISTDGVTWTFNGQPQHVAMNYVTWDGAKFVSAGKYIKHSVDGLAWSSMNYAHSASPSFGVHPAWNGSKFAFILGDGLFTSTDGIAWSLTSVPSGLMGISASTPGLIIAVGTTFWSISKFGLVASSTDGVNWAVRSTLPKQHWLAFAHNGTAFCALSAAGAAVSTDGVVWSMTSTPNTFLVGNVAAPMAVGPDGTFCIVSRNKAWTSPDGITWSGSALPLSVPVLDLVGSSTGFLLVAPRTLLFSSDGVTWRDSGTNTSFYTAGIWTGSRFVVVGNGVAAVSTDGTTWLPVSFPATGSITNIIAAANGVVSVLNLDACVTSADGSAWTIRWFGTDAANARSSMAWGNGTYVLSTASGHVLVSSDAITWTPFQSMFTGIAASNRFAIWNGSQFLLLYGREFMLSSDGVNWSMYVNPTAAYGSVAYGNNVLAVLGTVPLFSLDGGASFVGGTAPVTSDFKGMAFGRGRFVAVGRSVAASSQDGINWTLVAIPAGNYTNVCWCGTLFVAVGQNCCATSPDGVTWTSRNIGFGAWSDVASNGSLYVAVNQSGVIATSLDAITWTPLGQFVLGNAALQFSGIAFGGGLFCAGSASNAIAISADGVNWKVKPCAVSMTALSYEDEQGLFVGGSSTGGASSAPLLAGF